MAFSPCQQEFHSSVWRNPTVTIDSKRIQENIREDCVADEIKQKEYLGDSIALTLLINTESFQADEFGENTIKREAKTITYKSNVNQPSWYTHEVRTEILYD